MRTVRASSRGSKNIKIEAFNELKILILADVRNEYFLSSRVQELSAKNQRSRIYEYGD